MTPAVVLAAGASHRMGSPKALLPIDGRPAVDVVSGMLRAAGCEPVVLVLGKHVAEVRAGARLEGVTVVEHAGWAAGRTSSVQAGLAALPADADAFVLALVDMPYVIPQTVQTLLEHHKAARPDLEVLVPVHGNKRGHPVLLRRAVFRRIAELGPDEPLSKVVRASRVLEVPVYDAAIHCDLDTPEDLKS